MRRGCLFAIFTVLLVLGIVVAVIFQVFSRNAALRSVAIMNTSCDASVGPTQPGEQGRGASDVANLELESKNIAQQIIAIGKARKLSPRAWQIAIQAGMTESHLRNLSYGDRDSLGIFQMRPSMGWGTVEQLQDITYEINKFYDVLLNVPDWENQRPGDMAQAVERSGFPDRYHKWEPMAAVLIESVGQVANVVGCGQSVGNLLPPSRSAAKAIQFALGEQGKPYVWGATGPNSYDCSGLMLRAYGAAEVALPRVSRDQYRAGAMLNVRDAQAGDLIFLATDPSDPTTIHHVMMYLGDGRVVEAQQTGVPVHIRKFSFDEAEVVPQAVRPGV